METHPALKLVAELCRTLAAENINYCHWKSNVALDRSASGENDLDLLVSRADAQRFTEILYRLGFIEAQAAKEFKLPGVLDYYGFDQPSGTLVHVHTHFQLVLGNDLSKNYRIPLEQAYLSTSVQEGLFRVPLREMELVIFVIRMVLKHSTWDSLLMRHGCLSSSERRELEFLATPETLAKMDSLLEKYLPFLDRSLFDDCLRSIQPGSSLRHRVRTGEWLQKVLASCARQLQGSDILLKLFRRIWQPVQARVFRHFPRRRLANGGLFIAIVGGDGSGKSTAIDELYRWLSGKFDIKKAHMGKPAWSRTTILMRGLLKIGTLLHLYPFERFSEQESYGLPPDTEQFPGYPYLVRTVCTARDRYLTYLRARRYSSNGGLVLCDRYSIPGFLPMDGPHCERVSRTMKPNRIIKLLTRLENSYYQKILLPDLLIVLRVIPEIAVRRKTDESEVSVRARSTQVWELDWSKVPAHVLDASQPKEKILSEIKALVWLHL
jgi:thymidylate kinase